MSELDFFADQDPEDVDEATKLHSLGMVLGTALAMVQVLREQEVVRRRKEKENEGAETSTSATGDAVIVVRGPDKSRGDEWCFSFDCATNVRLGQRVVIYVDRKLIAGAIRKELERGIHSLTGETIQLPASRDAVRLFLASEHSEAAVGAGREGSR